MLCSLEHVRHLNYILCGTGEMLLKAQGVLSENHSVRKCFLFSDVDCRDRAWGQEIKPADAFPASRLEQLGGARLSSGRLAPCGVGPPS